MSKQESKSYAELEADLFLAERAFKRVPSDENKEALENVKTVFEALQGVKEQIKATAPAAPKAPAKPKANTKNAGKQKAPASPKAPESTDPDPDGSKKN